MSLKREATVSVLSIWTGTTVNYILAFVATPIIVHSLGNEKYGIWSLAIQLTGYYGILDFGIGTTTIKFFSEYYSRNDEASCNRLVNTVAFVYTLISTIIIALTVGISAYADVLFKISQENAGEMKWIILIVGGNLAIGFMTNVFKVLPAALRRFEMESVITVTISILRYVTIIIFLKNGFKLIAMAVIVVSYDMLSNILYFYLSRRLFPGLRIGVSYIDVSLIKEKFSFAGNTFLILLTRLVTQKTDQILIGVFIGTKYIVYYAIAESLLVYVRKIPKGISRLLVPFASHLYAVGDKKLLEGMLYIIPKYLLSFYLFIFFIFYEYGIEGIRLWMGKGYDQSVMLLLILMSAEIIISVTNAIGQTLIGMGENKVYARLSIFEAALNISLSIIFVTLLDWGVVGIAFGTLISVSLTRGLLFPVFLSRTGLFSASRYLKKTILPAASAFVIFFGVYRGIFHIIHMNYTVLWNLIVSAAAASILFLITGYLIAFNEITVRGSKINFEFK